MTGATGALLVPAGVAFVEGTIGIVIAVLGGLVALSAYILSARERKKPPVTRIEVFERAIVASQGDASREVSWNEVVEVLCKQIPMPDGTPSMALVFETVGAPPLLIMVGGRFSDESETAKLIESLRSVWVPIWCRRARVLAQQQDGVQVGQALLRCECVTVGGEKLAWSAIRGFQTREGVDCLDTSQGDVGVEQKGATSPFPSAAKRIAALADSPPEPPLLPLPQQK